MTYSPRSVVAVQSAPEWLEVSAHPALSHWVLGYWDQVVREGTRTIRTLPDGCVDIVCDLSRPEAPVALIGGPQAEPATHSVVAPSRLLGARLHPLAAATLIGPRLDELTDDWQPLERFLGRPAVELANSIASANMANAAGILDAFFSEHLIGRIADPRLTQSLAAIFATKGQATVADLARAAATTERTLRRMFEKHVGLTPKRFARVVRIQAALRRAEAEPDWARLADELGYSDQSHLIREMHTLFGDTPTGMLSGRLAPG